MRRFQPLILTAGLALMLDACGTTASTRKPTTPAPATAEPTADSTAAASAVPVIAPRYVFVNVSTANVRKGPSKDEAVVTKLSFLDKVEVTGYQDGEWMEVKVPSSGGAAQTAWIHRSLISVTKEEAEAAKAAKSAGE